ncbi:M28 family peptidase [Wenzhouxiangella sp. AB-CW3]|uniref:M28 family peptidase n=1 Tax=Wenzhouxiangella sp. AB-CW3 TaxID=2771012 RepID=UPI00168A9A77|nr:M28 family peptidase [Wenzhouxiangella sp. AB-CW3]QOC22194.1 M28 family peptidase [Wenzhouxiangella sp. AB-CW3]
MTGTRRIVMAARIGFWLAIVALLAGSVAWMTRMPGESVSEPLAELTSLEARWAARLERDVYMLADEIGVRNMGRPGSMTRTVEWLDERFSESGLRPVHHQYTLSGSGHADATAVNVVAEIPGSRRADEYVIIGAHYDTVPGSPGANDNASAVAVLLALADWFSDRPQSRTLRFVAFANEEPPFYLSADMGSYAYADSLRAADEQVSAMMALDGLGFYSTEPGSQQFPAPGLGLAYSDRAEFIAFVTRMRDRSVLTRSLGAFRREASIPSEGAVLPSFLPGVGWSDHWSFWQHGYPAFLVTDTLPFRDPNYHSPADTPQRLDFERMARLAVGLRAVVLELAGE